MQQDDRDAIFRTTHLVRDVSDGWRSFSMASCCPSRTAFRHHRQMVTGSRRGDRFFGWLPWYREVCAPCRCGGSRSFMARSCRSGRMDRRASWLVAGERVERPGARSSTTVNTLVRTCWRPKMKSRNSDPRPGVVELLDGAVPERLARAHRGAHRREPSGCGRCTCRTSSSGRTRPCTSGTPNGHASTQFEQPMQRGFSADCTMPSSVCLIASAGHTCAQVGSSQCMHTIGAVWVLAARSMRSRWISDWPRWVPHSMQACTHASQPMQRLWSITNIGLSSMP